MARVILEHRFEDRPFDAERYRQAQADNAWCLKAHDVSHVLSYVSPDGRRMICVFDAPDAEAVRRVADQLGYSFDSVWSATVIE